MTVTNTFSFMTLVVLVLFSLFSPELDVDAAALPSIKLLQKRDVWSPKIVDPKVGTVWRVGDLVNVTW